MAGVELSVPLPRSWFLLWPCWWRRCDTHHHFHSDSCIVLCMNILATVLCLCGANGRGMAHLLHWSTSSYQSTYRNAKLKFGDRVHGRLLINWQMRCLQLPLQHCILHWILKINLHSNFFSIQSAIFAYCVEYSHMYESETVPNVSAFFLATSFCVQFTSLRLHFRTQMCYASNVQLTRK